MLADANTSLFIAWMLFPHFYLMLRYYQRLLDCFAFTLEFKHYSWYFLELLLEFTFQASFIEPDRVNFN